jgi:putative PEP-CTERM system TPR-repeat lipoprotein
LISPALKLGADIAALEAQAKIGLGEKDAAKEVLQAASRREPESASLHLATARLSLSENDLVGAADAVAAALKTSPDNVEALLLSGGIALAQRRLPDAETAFRRAHDLAENKTEAGAGLAETLLTMGKLDEAKPLIDALAKASPGLVGVEYLRGWHAHAREQWLEAENILQKVIQATPKHPQVLMMLADACFRQKKYNQAETYAKTLNGIYPNLPLALKLLGAIYLKQQRADDAINTLTPLAKLDPPDPGALSLLSFAHYAAGDAALGAEFLSKAQTLVPNSPELQTQQAIGDITSGNVNAGIASLEKLAAAAPDSKQPRELLTFAHLQQGDTQAAIETAIELTKLNPQDPMAHNLLGLAYVRNKDNIRASEAFAAAVKANPKFAPALANQGFLALGDKDEALAKTKLAEALRADKGYTAASLALAGLAERKGDRAQVIKLLTDATAAQPKAAQPRWLLADQLLRDGKREEAQQMADEAFQIAPKRPDSRLQMGTFLLRTGQAEEAYEVLTALEREKSSPRVTYLLAEAARLTKRYDEALRHYRTVEAASPDALQVQWGIFATQMSSKAYSEAETSITKITATDPLAGAIATSDLASAQGHHRKAATALSEALTQKPSTPVFLRYANALNRTGDFAALRKAYSEWLTQHPDDVAVRLHAGAFEIEQRDYPAAQRAFEAILVHAPDDLMALNNLAWLYDEAGDERALAIAEKAYLIKPDAPEVMDTLGWILVRTDERHRGLKLLEQAHAALPEEPTIAYHFAYGLAESGAKDQAAELLTALLENGQQFDAANDARALQRRLSVKPGAGPDLDF